MMMMAGMVFSHDDEQMKKVFVFVLRTGNVMNGKGLSLNLK
jgi:hypothetical protein